MCESSEKKVDTQGITERNGGNDRCRHARGLEEQQGTPRKQNKIQWCEKVLPPS